MEIPELQTNLRYLQMCVASVCVCLSLYCKLFYPYRDHVEIMTQIFQWSNWPVIGLFTGYPNLWCYPVPARVNVN